MTHFVYIKSEPQLWTTGFYRPDGSWEAHEDFSDPGVAAARVAWLNGAGSIEKSNEIAVLEEEVRVLKELVKLIDDAGLLATINKLEERLILADQIIAAMDEAIGVASIRAHKLAEMLNEPMLNDGQEKEV